MANYKLLTVDGTEVQHNNLQEKGWWCSHGLKKEHVFVSKFGRKFGVEMNKEKDSNPYSPDLYQTYNNCYADLKTQNTPFFQAQNKYNIDPQFAVTFNVKDYERYCKLYPQIAIYFAVDWVVTGFVGYGRRHQVQPMRGIWWTDLPRIHDLVNRYPRHSYMQRVDDQKGNAKDSFVFDLRDELFTKIA